MLVRQRRTTTADARRTCQKVDPCTKIGILQPAQSENDERLYQKQKRLLLYYGIKALTVSWIKLLIT